MKRILPNLTAMCYNSSMMTERICSFGPIVDENSRVVVLGSMPSVQSLTEGFYYANPRNAFWRILAEVYGIEIPETWEEKQALVRGKGIALWDAARSCERNGSLDSNMRQIELNDFDAFFARYGQIGTVLLNGGTACRLFMRWPGAREKRTIALPSTSPAYTLSYEKKLQAWREALIGGER